TLVDHDPKSSHFVGGQANAIYQFHPRFRAPYTGTNSLRPAPEGIASYVATVFIGARLLRWTEVFLDVEMAAGSGLSQALGMAGFPNVDVVRNPTLGPNPYLARLLVRQIVPLGTKLVPAERGHLSMATRIPEDRIELKIGKLSTVDTFDTNAVGS